MAGMETLEVHSKSYLVRWVNVKSNHTLSWSIQPHKKSLNFGIFKHPGHSALPGSDSHSTDSNENLPSSAVTGGRHSNNNLSVIEKLTGIGLKQIKWVGKCEADKIAQGTHDVTQNEGGNYALVFDNTFSKQLSKTVTLVLLTYPTAVPPKSGLAPPASHANGQPFQDGASAESLRPMSRRRGNSNARPPTAQNGEAAVPSTVHRGLLHKRRRKRHQGWARRFFALDFTSSTLSYYHDPNSATLRGSIPLHLAAVACNEKTREISVDSGAEIWHLRASNDQEFVEWKRALEKASHKAPAEEEKHPQGEVLLRVPSQGAAPPASSPAEDREWIQVETLVGRMSASRDMVRKLAKDTDPKYQSTASTLAPVPSERPRDRSPSPSPSQEVNSGDFGTQNRPFWKRKTSGSSANPSVRLDTGERKPSSVVSHPEPAEDVHDNLMGLLRDMDSVLSEFSSLITQSEQRRNSPTSAAPRRSMESDVSQEFFDAEAGDGNDSPLLTMHGDSDDEEVDNTAATAAQQAEEEVVADDAPSDSEEEETPEPSNDEERDRLSSLFPAKPKSLTPLPLDKVSRRDNIPAPKVMPPSLIGFLRKNVGKDLSQISMPVSANEPLSLLQRAAEVLEYSTLLDKATSVSDPVERLAYVTAFALASLSSNRVKERAIRKPFNPMLGETYELIREDLGFRFVAEKVSHRPVQLAYHADGKDWSLTQSPMPTQKFWGKSAEIVTEGKIRLALHATGEHYSWSSATSFLRNIIAGEKYVEPVGEMSVLNETSGHKAISTFKAGGIFSGRSEEVSTKILDPNGTETPIGLSGTWTQSLTLTKNSSGTGTIWSAGQLVPNAPKHYGMTSFAAALNEFTRIEKDTLPPTDSRLRPDQRALEDNDLDKAEDVKVKLEEGQRARRREMEATGENWAPRWFTQVASDGEVVWRLRNGRDGYWEERGKGEWNGVVPVFG
ncbi:oxysterol-binding protein related protein OSH3 [Aspergillus glaucus CBS 516.65]|uniref:PH domain-containing protein n=1 Tax=Aspergillus glaucus CBS 516.65 TaxID=1160497 RepID=A0A1L9VJN4_ASPGL|nr:hypothetical protein ASPGLDRAFT_171125 [Aspergillus glaucus CBS 516.65]OJJ84139.1 hypothetical protein ASPGLDRAFT_171125 [Aspergillus glaucus CBS 516.65]